MPVVFNGAVKAEPLGPRPGTAPTEFHRRLPGYRPTPLLDLPELAGRMGVGSIRLTSGLDIGKVYCNLASVVGPMTVSVV